MQVIESLTVSERALVRISREVARLKPDASDIMVLTFMSRFINADGTTVDGFAPGYTIEFVRDHKGRGIWAKAHLPDGTEIHFIPRLASFHGKSYALDVASGYTLSLEPTTD